MKILVIEGMGNMPVIRNNLIAPMKARGHKFEVDYLPWAEYAKAKVLEYDLIVGHSLGGHSVIKLAELARIAKKMGLTIKTKFLVIDGRWQSVVSWFDFLIPFQPNFKAPEGAEIYCFYQKLPLPGYAVDGAKLNQRVVSTHGSIPGNAHVVAWMDKFLRENLK